MNEDAARERHLEATAGAAGGDRQLITWFFQHVATGDLLAFAPDDLAGAVLSTKALAGEPAGGVRVFTPSLERHGWASGHTVVEIVTADVPFLVDSVLKELERRGIQVHVIAHPQFLVRRAGPGSPPQVIGLNTASAGLPAPQDVRAESWMHIEISRQSDPAGRQELRAALERVLADVHAAVADYEPMRDRAAALAASLAQVPPGLEPESVAQARELLDWICSGQFIFIGAAEYRLRAEDGQTYLVRVPGTGLGVLADPHGRARPTLLSPVAAAKAMEPAAFVFTKANAVSTVHRDARLDYIGIKITGADGRVTGEHRFLGLFTSRAYLDPVLAVPFVSGKVRRIQQAAGYPAGSHLGNDLLGVLESYPRDELFLERVERLTQIAIEVVHLRERRRTRVFLRADEYGRFVTAVVFLPRDRYNTDVRLRMQELLRTAFGGDEVEYRTRVSESSLAQLYFVVHLASSAPPGADEGELERRIVEATRTWDEGLADAAGPHFGEELAASMLARYRNAFATGYKEDVSPRVAVTDIATLESLSAQAAVRPVLYQTPGSDPAERRMKLFSREAIILSDVLPVFTHLGVRVTDERPYRVRRADGTSFCIYDFGLRVPPGTGWPASSQGALDIEDAFTAVWEGQAESDRFNALVLRAGLTWRQVVVLRAMWTYLRQAGTTYSRAYVEDAILANPAIARALVELFEARFDPQADPGERERRFAGLVTRIEAQLAEVASLDEDRILRRFLAMIQATWRTSFFAPRAGAGVAFKLDPGAIPQIPEPVPEFEIWVYHPRVEGTHLRFGPVARGGLRWSDRREDFRTEVLGLVKAQMVKNALIVPTGSKGGFYAKRLPDPARREAWRAEGIAAYRLFVAALLDVTDNRAGQDVEPPPGVVRYDGDDPYLVVAADKGTATFSDIANEVAASYGFWLDDAFASGGSAGFDHKGMGITARGAWVSVQRHFRELGVDVQSQDFTAVGIGDMSGDVFGNGMLRSEHIRLVAAFDHRHVFVDPDPDAATGFAERRRLFELPGSSWDDYDRSLISPGGGVFRRDAKSVQVTGQMAAALGLGQVAALTPSELVQAVLRAPVDLLWNGGIGTYVKATAETDAQIGDRGNDAVRVNGRELRARVVGEGGNLGFSQLGRIEAAEHGVLLNTDAIDNAAGVNTSDREVNIKILLSAAEAAGDLTRKQRNELLAAATGEVAAAVLRDNYEQNVLLANARAQGAAMTGVHMRFMHWLTSRGELDRELEFLPGDAEIARRAASGRGLTTPEMSVLAAYAKLALKRDLAATSLPGDPALDGYVRAYFPQGVAGRFAGRLAAHPLRREIVVNALANSIVNRGGVTFAFRAAEQTNASVARIAQAYVVATQVFDQAAFVASVEALDNVVPVPVQSSLYLTFRRLLDRTVRWWVSNRPARLDISAEIERFSPAITQLRPLVPGLLPPGEVADLEEMAQRWEQAGVPAGTASDASTLIHLFTCLDIVELAGETGCAVDEIAGVYFAAMGAFDVGELLNRVRDLDQEDRWNALARAALRDDLYDVLKSITRVVLATTPLREGPLAGGERVAQWAASQPEAIGRLTEMMRSMDALGDAGLAPVSVAVRALRAVVRVASVRE